MTELDISGFGFGQRKAVMRMLKRLHRSLRKARSSISRQPAKVRVARTDNQRWLIALLARPTAYVKSRPWQVATGLLCLFLSTLLIILNMQKPEVPKSASNEDSNAIPVLSVESRIPTPVSMAGSDNQSSSSNFATPRAGSLPALPDQSLNQRGPLLTMPNNGMSSEIRSATYETDSAAIGLTNVHESAAWLTGTIEEVD